MYYLKLTKARSYRGHGLNATAKNPIVTTEDEAVFKAALASGYFSEAAPDEKPPRKPDSTGTIEALDTMNAVRLRAYAKKMGLAPSWPNGTDADTIRADIRAALTQSGEDDTVDQFMSGGGDEGNAESGEV